MPSATQKQSQSAPAQPQQQEQSGLLDQVIQQTEDVPEIKKRCGDKYGISPDSVVEFMRRSIFKPGQIDNPNFPGQGQPRRIDAPLFTNAEVFAGMVLIANYNLDPVTKEIYLVRGNDGRVFVIIGVDGWIKCCQRVPGYDGHTFEEHRDEKERLVAITCTIFNKHRTHPSAFKAYMSDWNSGQMKWKTGAGGLPNHMLLITSYRHAARFYTSISALTPDEFVQMEAVLEATERAQKEDPLAYSRGTKSQRLAQEAAIKKYQQPNNAPMDPGTDTEAGGPPVYADAPQTKTARAPDPDDEPVFEFLSRMLTEWQTPETVERYEKEMIPDGVESGDITADQANELFKQITDLRAGPAEPPDSKDGLFPKAE